MELADAYRRSVLGWKQQIAAVSDDQWDRPTPCSDWTVRDLANHVVGEDRWTVPLVEGKTMADVGDALDGDLLGSDPRGAAAQAADDALASVEVAIPEGLTVHLSYGDEELDEYLRQLVADHVIHGWDLAVATGGDSRIEPDLVDDVARWYAERESLYRQAGIVGERPEGDHDSPQAALLAGFGRRPDWTP
jgi:uncharacterized protein (TIGR03086 family)